MGARRFRNVGNVVSVRLDRAATSTSKKSSRGTMRSARGKHGDSEVCAERNGLVAVGFNLFWFSRHGRDGVG